MTDFLSPQTCATPDLTSPQPLMWVECDKRQCLAWSLLTLTSRTAAKSRTSSSYAACSSDAPWASQVLTSHRHRKQKRVGGCPSPGDHGGAALLLLQGGRQAHVLGRQRINHNNRDVIPLTLGLRRQLHLHHSSSCQTLLMQRKRCCVQMNSEWEHSVLQHSQSGPSASCDSAFSDVWSSQQLQESSRVAALHDTSDQCN